MLNDLNKLWHSLVLDELNCKSTLANATSWRLPKYKTKPTRLNCYNNAKTHQKKSDTLSDMQW